MSNEDVRWLLRCAAGHRDRSLWWWALAGFVLLLILLNSRATPGSGGLLPADRADGAAAAWGAFTGVAVTVGDVTAAPHSFLGVIVTVSGEVNRVLSSRAFTLGGGAFGGAELLVVAAEVLPDIPERPLHKPVLPGDLVQVTGPVHRFDRTAFQRETGVVLGKARFAGWGGRPAILALDVRITPRLSPPPGALPAPPPPGSVQPGAVTPGPAAPAAPGAPGASPASPIPAQSHQATPAPPMGYIPEPPPGTPATPTPGAAPRQPPAPAASPP